MTDAYDRYDRLARHFSAIIADVPEDRWDAATPCAEWDVADVVAHVAQSERDFLDRHGFAEGLPERADRTAWPAVAGRVREVLADPDRATTTYDGYFGPAIVGETLADFYADDLLLHGWDVARGAGLDEHQTLPPGEAARVLASLRELPEEALRSEGVYGPPVPVSEDADTFERLLAFTGRRP